jgi:uncharacterized protein (DUF4415 family)
MSDAKRRVKTVMTSDGKVLTERPDGTYGPAPAGRSDWARVVAMSDDEITANALSDPDAQPLDEAFWRTAKILTPPALGKKHIGLRLDADVLEWFRAQGRGWQTHMNAVLRAYYEARRESHE